MRIYTSFLNNELFWGTRNFKGKPFGIPLDYSTKENITFKRYTEKSVIYFQLIYNIKNKGIEEMISGETKSQFVIGGHFPLYYYIKIKNPNYINIDVNLRLNSYNETVLHNNFGIRGYLLEEDTINRKINGEYINLNNPIIGFYSDTFKVGLLQVNQPIEKDFNYLLIEIINNDQEYINSHLLVELVTKEYNDDRYFVPVNQYILESFDGENNTIRTENKYYISSKEKGADQANIELSASYDDIEIVFDNKSNVNQNFTKFQGFKRYRIYKAQDDNVYFSVINPKKRNTTYMMRQFYSGLGGN